MVVDAVYTATKDDYIAAQRLYINHRRKNLKLWLILAATLLLLGCGFVFASSWGLQPALLICCGFAAFWLLLAFALRPLVQRIIFGRRYKVEARLLTDVHIVLDQTGILVEISGVGSGRTEWAAFNTWWEDKLVFVLVVNYAIRILPKRAFTIPQQDAMRALFESHIGSHGATRRLS